MAKVVSTLFISADGVAEIDPAWHSAYFDENMARAVGEVRCAAFWSHHLRQFRWRLARA